MVFDGHVVANLVGDGHLEADRDGGGEGLVDRDAAIVTATLGVAGTEVVAVDRRGAQDLNQGWSFTQTMG